MKQILLALFLLTGCASLPVHSTPPSSAPAAKGWLPSYEAFVRAHITPAMLAASPGTLCPNYIKVTEQDFWAALVRSIAYAESGFNPADIYVEKFIDTKTGVAARSVGLLQLSVGDTLNYHGTYISKLTADNIADPIENLGAGMEIMDALIQRYSGVQVALGKYWSTIRPGAPAVARLRTEIPACYQ